MIHIYKVCYFQLLNRKYEQLHQTDKKLNFEINRGFIKQDKKMKIVFCKNHAGNSFLIQRRLWMLDMVSYSQNWLDSCQLPQGNGHTHQTLLAALYKVSVSKGQFYWVHWDWMILFAWAGLLYGGKYRPLKHLWRHEDKRIVLYAFWYAGEAQVLFQIDEKVLWND